LFPKIDSEIMRVFAEAGLDSELKNVLDYAYNLMSSIGKTKTFLSNHEVLQVLTSIRYDPDDKVYVVSRDDQQNGFWIQKRRRIYISYLEKNAGQTGHINQTRVKVWDDAQDEKYLEDNEEETLLDITMDLKKLHNLKTFFSYPKSALFKYDTISKLLFGFTLSTKHKYAIISVPPIDDLNPRDLTSESFGPTIARYSNYDAADGPMKAIITCDLEYIKKLTCEIEDLLRDPNIIVIR
jgi:hypothetical protein